jgi:chromosome segregation ATPase
MNGIKRLIVENFQSHKKTMVEFEQGLNVIVGPSDFGKSALVRALRWVFYNEPRGANFIRAGARVCQVQVEMDDGCVVTRLRSTTGKNQYLLQRCGEDELVFEGFGNEIPVEIMQATGIRKIVVDERYKAELNLGAQLEAPFLLAENGAIKAKVIGQLGGVHILDWAQRSVNTELRRLGEQEKRRRDELEGLAEALKFYAHLPQLQERIRQIEALVHQVEEAAGKIEGLTALKSEWQENLAAVKRVEQVLTALGRLDEAERACRRLAEYSEEYRNFVGLHTEISHVDRLLAQTEQVLANTRHVPELGDCLQRADPLLREWQELSRIAADLENIDKYLRTVSFITERTKELGKAEKKLAEVEINRKRWDMYLELRQGWQEHEQALRGACLAAERYQKEIDSRLPNFREFLLKIGKCPVCFGKLDTEAVERVMDEYK